MANTARHVLSLEATMAPDPHSAMKGMVLVRFVGDALHAVAQAYRPLSSTMKHGMRAHFPSK